MVKDLLLQYVTRRLFDRFEVCIASMSVPRDESEERKPHHDDDERADCKDSKGQMFPRPAPAPRNGHSKSTPNQTNAKEV